MPHVTFQSPLIENAHDNGRAVKMKNFETFIFGSQSTRAKELAKYFFFDGNTQLIARSNLGLGSSAEQNAQNLLTQNFNIAVVNNIVGDSFHSTIAILPQQSIFGVGFALRRHFREYFWACVEVPIVHVRNNLKLVETVIDNGGGGTGAVGFQGNPSVANMDEAFRQAGMLYGKIDGAQKKTGVPDVTIRLGYDAIDRKDLYVSPYIGLMLPTSNKPKAVYMFEPITGNGGHLGLMIGTRGELDNRKFCDGRLWWSWYVESRYLLENTQKRSFDLYPNGPWSRYLSVWPNAAAQAAGGVANADFGINYLTQDCKVTPGLTLTISNQLTYVGTMWNAGLGYNTYVRQAEKIKLATAWTEGPMITDLDFGAGGGGGANINAMRSIGNELVFEDETFAQGPALIKESQINLGSAAHPSAVSHMGYGVIGIYCPCKRPRTYQAGVSYEFSRQNTAVNRWGVWGTMQISF